MQQHVFRQVSNTNRFFIVYANDHFNVNFRESLIPLSYICTVGLVAIKRTTNEKYAI